MPKGKKLPVIKPKSAVRTTKKYRNRRPSDEGKVYRGKGNSRKK